MALPLFRAPLSALPLEPDSVVKFNELMSSGKLVKELYKAYDYVDSLPAMVPAGVTELCQLSAADVKKLADDNPEGVLLSGTLSQLVVDERALKTDKMDEAAAEVPKLMHST